jgi:uncharacterized protein YciI
MFVVLLTYVKPLPEVDRHMRAHVQFLQEHYAAKTFIASGRQVPRTGGVILARAASKEALVELMQRDPFVRNGVATFEVSSSAPASTTPRSRRSRTGRRREGRGGALGSATSITSAWSPIENATSILPVGGGVRAAPLATASCGEDAPERRGCSANAAWRALGVRAGAALSPRHPGSASVAAGRRAPLGEWTLSTRAP